MRRIGFTLMVVLLILCNANAQVTTYFYGRDKVHMLYLQPVITQYFASNKSEIWS